MPYEVHSTPNFNIVNVEGAAPVKMWTNDVFVEDRAIQQLVNVAKLPFIFKHVAAMPDVHTGIGATIGSVIATQGAAIPSAVGVDIGCGMAAVKTNLTAADLPSDLVPLRKEIERLVPHGRTDNGGSGDRGAWHNVPDAVAQGYDATFREPLIKIIEAHPKIGSHWVDRAAHHLGTLGTGNHFIEVCVDSEQAVWIMLHSGSRGAGNRIGSYFIGLAKEEMKRWFIDLPDADLAYLPQGTKLFGDYMGAAHWALRYASANRQVMLKAVLAAVGNVVRPVENVMEVNCHHNFIEMENHFGTNILITRKGATRARAGELGIIPGSMGARSYIVRGLGNPDSFMSCSHGAGRAMSRTEARRRFTLEDHIAATAGIECPKDIGVLDETPLAYKDIDAVMAAQAALVEPIHVLKQVLCVKGEEGPDKRRQKKSKGDNAGK